MKNGLCLLLLAAFIPLFLGGCTTDAPKPTDPPRISVLPQNRPERWEGQGMLGGMMGTR